MSASGSSRWTVFRVRGLPLKADDAVKAHLDTTICNQLLPADNVEVHEKFFITCAPNCYDEQREKIELVEFHKVPSFLARLMTVEPLGSVTVPANREDEEEVTFDAHFFGLTQLYTPQPDAPVGAE
jgi:hypothetical protein